MTSQIHVPNVDPKFRFHVCAVYRLLVEFQATEIRISNANEIPNFPVRDHSSERR